MKAAAMPDDEAKRLATLRGLNVLDTPREERFDRITRLARRMFDMPIAAISLVDADRQWFKSCMGLAAREVPRAYAFCAHAILSDALMVVGDSLADERFADNPLVMGEPHARFYAGYPVKATNGCRLGTLALIDHVPRSLNDEEREALRDLAAMVERELDLQPTDTLDPFTGITNRRGFLRMAQRCLSLCGRHDIPALLILFTLDRPILGASAPEPADDDLVVMTFAETMKHSFRESDAFARLDHTTFALLLTHTSTDGAERCVQRFLVQLAVENRGLPPDERIGCHWQVVPFDASRHNTVEALLTEASRNLSLQRRRQQ